MASVSKYCHRNVLFFYGIHPTHFTKPTTLQLRHNEHDGVSNHQPHDCLPNRLFRRRSKETSKLRVISLNSPGTGEFPAQRPVTRKMFPFDDDIMKKQRKTAVRIIRCRRTSLLTLVLNLFQDIYAHIWISISFQHQDGPCSWSPPFLGRQWPIYTEYWLLWLLMNEK